MTETNEKNLTSGETPVLGIGACLTGREVRFNGSSKSANQYVQTLGEHFKLRPFCPEMGIGLPVPRPPIHLVGDTESVRVLDVDSHQQDYTDALKQYAITVLNNAPELSGYILVKGSPSCGYDRVKRFNQKGNLQASDQQGMFASALAKANPLLPLEDDGRLNDPALRESFVVRVYAYQHWRQLIEQGLTAKGLIDFYSRYKYRVMAHDVSAYKQLGPMLANVGKDDIEAVANLFIDRLMTALKQSTTRRSHSNVLFHLSGYLKHKISADEKQRLRDLIEQYRLGQLPLIVPITMLRHHFANNPNAYIEQQILFEPYAEALQLNNEV